MSTPPDPLVSVITIGDDRFEFRTPRIPPETDIEYIHRHVDRMRAFIEYNFSTVPSKAREENIPVVTWPDGSTTTIALFFAKHEAMIVAALT